MDSGLRRSSSMTVSSSTGRSFRRTSYPTQHSHLLRHEALRRDHGFTSVCRIHNVLSWFTAAQTGLKFLTVADASVLEGLDEFSGTVDVEQNSIRPEPNLARNLLALPKRGGTRLFATVTVRTAGSSLLSGVTVFAVQAARATCLTNVFNDHEILGMCHQPASFFGDVSGVNTCLRSAIGTHTSTGQQTACTNFLPVMFKGYVVVPHMHPASDCVHVLLTGLVAVVICSVLA